MVTSAPHQQIGYLVRSYPRLTQTFILNEILALEALGWELQIFALENPHEPQVQAQAAAVRAPVTYLELPKNGGRSGDGRNGDGNGRHSARPPFARYWKALSYVLANPALDEGYTHSSRFDCLRQAAALAAHLEATRRQTGRGITHLHAHFAHDPALIALLVHRMTGLPYSFTAHARDLYQTPPSALVQRAQQATTVVTCCKANADYLVKVLPAGLRSKIRLVYHGVDPQVFQPAGPGEAAPAADPPLILSVGRLVEKKGFPDLIDAMLKIKERGSRFRLEIYGDGPLKSRLQDQINRTGLQDEVLLAGYCTQEELVPIYQRAALFVLTPSLPADGDRDGIPNVLVEAMACGLPVVSTEVAGIPELVEHGETGLLYLPDDRQGLVDGLAELLEDAAWRRKLGAAGRQRVERRFDSRQSARQLEAVFGQGVAV